MLFAQLVDEPTHPSVVNHFVLDASVSAVPLAPRHEPMGDPLEFHDLEPEKELNFDLD